MRFYLITFADGSERIMATWYETGYGHRIAVHNGQGFVRVVSIQAAFYAREIAPPRLSSCSVMSN